MEEMERKLDDWKPFSFDVLKIFMAMLDKPRIKQDEDENSMPPSEYMRQMLLTMEDRMAYLMKPVVNQNLRCALDFPENTSFKAIPTVIVFQAFVPGNVYNTTLTIRNSSQISRCLRSCCQLDPYFDIEFRGSFYSTTVAPGLAHVYNIKFVPEEKRDYNYQASFVTDEGVISVPIIAIGPRAILDIPDRIEVPGTAVKIFSSKTIFVRNVGDAPAIFTFFTDSSNFWIEPSTGQIEQEESIQFTVYFQSNISGEFESNLYLKYETGEIVRTELRSSAINCTIRMDRGSVKMEDTYLGMSRSKTLTIHNRSDYIVKYQWMCYKDSKEDDARREEYKKLFELAHNMEIARNVSLEFYNICMPDIHELICERIYGDEITSLMNENFQYNHLCFLLAPMEGEIWPHMSSDVTILFRALEVGEICSTAYLEVSGREDRIPLSLCGIGKGPVFRLNVITIDVDKIYMYSLHYYEIVAANKGYIAGTLVHKPKPSDFGGIIKIEPPSHTIQPMECKSFNLSFSSNRKGDFLERIDFVVKESLEIISLHVKGCVICPTLHFDKKCIDFGTIPLGFSSKQEVCLHNLSSVPVTYSITVLNDGTEMPLTHEDYAKAETKLSFPSNPREFVVQPEDGVVPARSFLKIRITYTANIVRAKRSCLRVDMWKSESDPIILPIIFRGDIASLSIKPFEISIRFCFINLLYTRRFNIENDSDLDGYFYIVPQSVSDNNSSIYYSMSTYQGFIKARQSKEIVMTLITRSLGKQSCTINMLTMGMESPIAACTLSCTGQGPVVSLQPTHMDFGDVQVLEEKTMDLKIINDAPIPAQFQIALSRKDSPWCVDPMRGELEPNESANLNVKIYLRDAGRYEDNILMTTQNSRTISVSVKANGVGCSAVFKPNVFPTFDIGLLLSHQKVNIPITMKNHGTRPYQLIWSNTPELRIQKGQIVLTSSKFQMHPIVNDLPANAESTVYCKIYWSRNETIHEEWYLFGQTPAHSKREIIATSTFKATFTEPHIVFSKKELTMRIDMSPSGDKYCQTDDISVTNKSGLDLNVRLVIKSPFYIITELGDLVEKTSILLTDQTTTKVCVKFQPNSETDNLYSKSYRTTLFFEYDEHPMRDKIKCKGSVNYPNLRFSSHHVNMACELGCSEEYVLTLTNEGPIPAIYKFVWLKESIKITKYQSDEVPVLSEEPTTVPKIDRSTKELKSTSWQSESHLVSQQIGAGDAPPESPIPPMNSPVSMETLMQRIHTNDDSQSKPVDTKESDLQEIKEFLMSIIDLPTHEDSDIDVLEVIGFEPRLIELVNEILDIVPHEGIVPPYTSQHVHFGFHGFERVRIEVTAACEIVRGPTEMVQVLGNADTVRYSVDKRVIDLGQQLFCESCKGRFNLSNECMRAFGYVISTSTLENENIVELSDSNQLTIEPLKGTVEPSSSIEITLNYRPMYLGPFNVEFRLKIAHLVPIVMSVTGVGIYPQVFLDLPQIIHPDKCPVEFGYRALRSLCSEFVPEQNEESTGDNEKNLMDDEWILVSIDETVPSVTDVNMAVERILTSCFIEENLYVLRKHNAARKKSTIPELFSLEYVIDLGNIVIGLTAHYSAVLFNYGPVIAEVRMRKLENKSALISSDIVVEFKKNVKLAVGSTVLLHVICSPTLARYTERKTELKHVVYLEVIHGCTIPVILTGFVTYPYITIDKKQLDFGNVWIGECSMMYLTLENEGLVDCDCKVEISMGRKKQNYCPFSVHQELGNYSPGHSDIIKVYFKPREACFVSAKLKVIVKMSLELQIITLTGHGVERKLNISEPIIQFMPTIPYMEIQEREFTVENNCEYPIEFFWHHLDDRFMHEDRIAKILAHYYGVREILLPTRKLGEGIPELLIEFYNSLVSEVMREQRCDEMSDVEEEEEDDQKVVNKEHDKETLVLRKKNRRKSNLRLKMNLRKETSFKKKKSHGSVSSWNSKKDRTSVSIISDLNSHTESLILSDPVEMEKLLLDHINELRKNPNFHKIMKDPVKRLFAQLELESTSMERSDEFVKPKKKVCIIFHGALFTAYQEIACRSARALGIPVLSIDTAILETAAFGKSECAGKLRQIINETYQDYTTRFSEYRDEMLETPRRTSKLTDTSRTQKSRSPGRRSPRSPRTDQTSKSGKRSVDLRDEEKFLLRSDDAPSDPLESYNKLSLEDETLISMDILSQYEHKVQAIRLLEKILPARVIAESVKDRASVRGSEKSTRKKQDNTFLEMDPDLLSEALTERLLKEDFERGFVLQTIDNMFLPDNIMTLMILLTIIGHVEFFLFVTFYNCVDICSRKIDELKQSKAEKIAEDTAKKIREIDEMSLSEYEELSEEDRNLYLEAILPIKKEEASLRKARFSEHLQELQKKKEERQMRSSEQKPKGKKGIAVSKSKLSVPINRDEVESKTVSSKRNTSRKKARGSPKPKKEILSREMIEIFNAMDEYHNSLGTIMDVIKNWDPIRKVIDTQSKATKAAKSKDLMETAREGVIHENNFHIWYVQTHDPWTSTMNDLVISQMEQNNLINDVLHKRIPPLQPVEPKTYSILAYRGFEDPNVFHKKDTTFELVSIAPLHEERTTESLSHHAMDTLQEPATSVRHNQPDIQNKRRKSKIKVATSSNNVDETTKTSLKTNDEQDTSLSNIELYREEAPKARLILQSNEKKSFKIRYRPLEIGDYEESYVLSIVDNPCNTYRIQVNGISTVPRIDMDPRVIFPKVMDNKIDEIDEPSFFLDTGNFDFGSLALLKRGERRTHRRKVNFTLRNITPIKAEVFFSFMDGNTDGFNVQPEILDIPPHESRTLAVSAGVIKLGSHRDKLYILVKNNPHVDIIELRCNGTRLDVELDEKQLSFGRVLLYRKEDRISTIRNRSSVPIFWRIEWTELEESQITFTPTEGLLRPLKEQRIEFSYDAKTIGIVQNTMSFQVFLHEEDVEPVYTDAIAISGETYDVSVDIDYANPIDLKAVKVGHPTNACFIIKNRGNYEVKYVIKFNEDAKLTENVARPTNVKKNLEIETASGSVQPQKSTTVQMTFLPKNEMRLKEAPILKCHILDANQQTTIVAEFPLTVSLIAYYNRFLLKPYPEINFGTTALCTKTTMNLDIENIGSFPFHYAIDVPKDSIFYAQTMKKEAQMQTKKKDTARTTDVVSKREKRSTKTEKTDAIVQNMINVGPFIVTKIEGDVEAGQIDTIPIECYPEIVGSQQEQIVVLVPDTVAEYSNGQSVTLSIDSCIPSIDFNDLDRIFRSNHIVNNIEDFLCPKEVGAHTVYARQSKCLYFRRVIVSSAHTTCFELHNGSVVPANVEIKAFVKSPTNAKPTTFVVEPQRERIPAQGHKRINVSFSPSLIESFHGYLEITLNLPAHLDVERLVVNLIGEACVPEVTIIEPSLGILDGPAIRFQRTLVAESSVEKFAFQNIGLVQANVIVEIYDDPNAIYGFTACPDTKGLLHTTDYSDNTRRNQCAVVRTMPEDVARFEVTFRPREVDKYTANIRLFVVDNPYDNLTIDLEGESFLEVIILQDLDLINLKTNNHRESTIKKTRLTSRQSLMTDINPPVFLSYKLDYGMCHINKMYKRNFKIVNKSTDRCFRFQWTAHPNVVFVPSVGHLRQSTSKQVTATLLESEPKKHDGTRLECVVSQIEISNQAGETSWDDRQTIVRWEKIDSSDTNMQDSLSKKSVEPSIEPEHRIIPGTIRCILLLMNAIVDYSEYSCSTLDVNFKDTLMFQKREYTFTLSNPGVINTDYVWVINMDEEFPKRISESTVRLSDKSRESRSRLASKSSRGVLYPTEDSSHDNLQLHRCKPLPSHEAFLDIKPRSCSCKGSDLYSSTACLTDRSTDSWLEGEDLPFEILPESGTLLPGESVECTLEFSPADVFDYKAYLTCKIENLNPNLSELVIPIKARSVLPYCHFDVPESDYISSGKRDPKLPGPIGYTIIDTILESIRVIELNIIGVGGTHMKRFPMINPTADDYQFSWRDRTARAIDEVPNFQCLVTEGIAERGKQTDMAFTFLSSDVGIFESFWLFSIEQYDLKCLFLFVAFVKEPVVHCTTPHLKMKPTVLGLEMQDCVTIVNKENFDIPFKVLGESLYSEGRYQSLSVKPMDGVIKGNDEQTFWINYKPTLIGEFQFSVQCTLKFLRNPLVFFVTTTTYSIVPTVTYTDTKGEIIKLLDHQDNTVDLGKIIPKKSTTLRFEITNSGNVTFYYTWDLGMTPEIIAANAYSISMPQKQGHVTSEASTTCCLILTAKRRMFIKNHFLALKISRGPTYRLILKAIVSKSPIEFSFRRYDFGGCYIREHDSSPYRTELRVSNTENKPLLLECKFEERPHMSVNLDGIVQALPGKSTVGITIAFRPLQETIYEETLTFLINSTIEENVQILGEGITYKIRLVNTRDKIIDLGSLPVFKTLIKKVSIINDGRSPVDVKFDLMSNLLGDNRYGKQRDSSCVLGLLDENVSILETKRSDTNDVDLQPDVASVSRVLTIEPSGVTRVRSNERVDLTIKFKPTSRMKMFTEKIGAKVDSTLLSLSILRGSCIGPEFRLNRTYIAFGTIVRGCITEAGLVLMNTGDVGAKFAWDTSNLPLDFKISPKSGYSSPGMNVHFLVKFEPTHERNMIEGYAVNKVEKFGSLELRISGACSKLPEPIDTLKFTTIVRTKQTKSVIVVNDTVLPWRVKPEISGEYFCSNEVLNISPEGSTSCTITYQPLVMNTEDALHKGTLVIRLPDNKRPLLYALHGLSLPPQAISTIVRQFPAKMKYTELLPVYNWMNRQQRFSCFIETVEMKRTSSHTHESSKVPAFSFTGNSSIDVLANDQRDYRAVFHSYKEAYFRFKITFINEDEEYQFYDIQYTITKPEVIEIIKLITTVRSTVCHVLQLRNPLKNTTITFTADCQHPGITLYDIPADMPPLSNGSIMINYYPLLTSEETIVPLIIYCRELGHFPYELRLTALPPLAEKTIHVTATLGSSTKFLVPIKNLTSRKADFVIQVNNDSFISPQKISIEGSGQDSIKVVYEPSDIENCMAILTASSNMAGIFTFPIVGNYALPKPQGPYTLTPSTPLTIRFKNVFKETKVFEFITNNSSDFETKTKSQEAEPKKEFDIVVNVKKNNEIESEPLEKCPVTGKLSVHCTDPRLSHIIWIYYLRGTIE